jgi:Benzoate membrane transport protein
VTKIDDHQWYPGVELPLKLDGGDPRDTQVSDEALASDVLTDDGVTVPNVYQPQFTVNVFLSLTMPLLFLVASQNASAIGALRAHGYRRRCLDRALSRSLRGLWGRKA